MGETYGVGAQSTSPQAMSPIDPLIASVSLPMAVDGYEPAWSTMPFSFKLTGLTPMLFNTKCWWARYRSIHVFRHFWWFKIFAQSSAPIYDLDNIVRCISSHLEFTQCHSDHFRPFAMLYCVFCLIFDVCSLISDLLLHWQTIYASPIL
jgi:hypothetical protein